MRVAGFGFRQGASVASLRAALAAAGGATGVGLLATLAEKADAAPLRTLAGELDVDIAAFSAGHLADMATLTRSDRVAARFGTGSVAEAAALAAAGKGARLLAPRAVSPDGMATAALAAKETG